jgi:hypothetical protein
VVDSSEDEQFSTGIVKLFHDFIFTVLNDIMVVILAVGAYDRKRGGKSKCMLDRLEDFVKATVAVDSLEERFQKIFTRL